MLLTIYTVLDRSQQKDENPAEMVIKLLMGSMYGETIIKPVETDTIVNDNKTIFKNIFH